MADTGMQRVEVQARGRVSAGDDAASSRKAAVHDTARQPSPVRDTEPEAAGPGGRTAREPRASVERDRRYEVRTDDAPPQDEAAVPDAESATGRVPADAAVTDETAVDAVEPSGDDTAAEVRAADGAPVATVATIAPDIVPPAFDVTGGNVSVQGAFVGVQEAQQAEARPSVLPGTQVTLQAETFTANSVTVGSDVTTLLSEAPPIDAGTAGQAAVMPEGFAGEGAVPTPDALQAGGMAAPASEADLAASNLTGQAQAAPLPTESAVSEEPRTFATVAVETDAQPVAVKDTAVADVDKFVPSASDGVVNEEARSADPKLNPAKPDGVFVNSEARQTAGEPVKAPDTAPADTAPAEAQGGFNAVPFEAPEAFVHAVSYDNSGEHAAKVTAEFQEVAPQSGPAEANVPVTNGGAEGRTMFFDGRGSAGSDNGAAAQVRSEAVGQTAQANSGEFAEKLSGARGVLRVDQVETIERIVKTMSMAVRRGQSEARILLQPPRLGSVRIELFVKNGVLNATFETQTQAARHVISSNLSHLKAALESQGIEVGGFNVTVEHEAGQPAFTQERESFENFPGGRLFAPGAEEDDEYDLFDEKRRMTAGMSVVDYFV
jgi:flagellar hook-length control protein FliK